MQLAAKSIEALQQLKVDLSARKHTDLQQRFELLDKYILREGDLTGKGTAARNLAASGRKDILRNIEVPIVYTKLDSEVAYQVGVFLTGFPIFGVVSSAKFQDQAVMMQALMGRDQQRYNWVGELSLALRDSLSYNICAVETIWHKQFYTQSAQAGSTSKQAIKYEGNKIKRIDPYNVFWDRSVHPNEVAAKGSYAGYVERYNYVACKDFLQGLNDEHKVFKNISAALKTSVSNVLYYEPKIRQDSSAANAGWDVFFGFPSATGHSNEAGSYEVLTMYSRLIPRDYGIIAPRAGSPDIYKLIYVNELLVYVERADADMLPISICQPVDYGHGLEDKGFAENLTDLQDVGTALQIARMKTMRRAAGDRALYDPTRIDKQHLLSDGPESKIPVKNNQQQKDLQSAYYRIPFEDSLSGVYAQEFALINSYADDVSGVNRAAQGNFVKGNKTLQEFDTIMSNSRARSQTRSMLLESNLFYKIKETLKENYIKYSISQEVYDRVSKQEVSIDPVQLQSAVLEFKISDGLLPSTKLLNADTIQLALQMFSTIPGFAEQYDAAGMAVRLLKGMGMEGLDDFKRQQPQPGGIPAAGTGAAPAQPAGNPS